METYFDNMRAGDGTKEKLVQDLRALVQDAEALVKAAGTSLVGKSRAELSAGLDRVKAGCRKVEENTVAGAKAADRLVREHPYQSMGVALGLGLIIGLLVSRD